MFKQFTHKGSGVPEPAEHRLVHRCKNSLVANVCAHQHLRLMAQEICMMCPSSRPALWIKSLSQEVGRKVSCPRIYDLGFPPCPYPAHSSTPLQTSTARTPFGSLPTQTLLPHVQCQTLRQRSASSCCALRSSASGMLLCPKLLHSLMTLGTLQHPESQVLQGFTNKAEILNYVS